MSAADRAWECALVLSQQYAERLTLAQQILCVTTVMRCSERAPLELIALAASVLGTRI